MFLKTTFELKFLDTSKRKKNKSDECKNLPIRYALIHFFKICIKAIFSKHMNYVHLFCKSPFGTLILTSTLILWTPSNLKVESSKRRRVKPPLMIPDLKYSKLVPDTWGLRSCLQHTFSLLLKMRRIHLITGFFLK